VAALVLDAEAVSALATERRTERLRRVRAILAEAVARDADVVVPTAVLAELYRGDRVDAGLDRILNGRGIRTVTTGRRIARDAGVLRHRDRLDSCHIVDCLVVATAVRLGGAVIATTDEVDMTALSRSYPNVTAHRV
jgi:predicted nucleic acid-binding protein